jgi:hypothetical protein
LTQRSVVDERAFNAVRAAGGDDGSVDWSMQPSGCLIGARISSLHPPFDRASLKHILGDRERTWG